MRELKEALRFCEERLAALQEAVFLTPPSDYTAFMNMVGEASALINMRNRFKEIIYGREQDL